MSFIISIAVFLAVAIGIGLLGTKLWLRPKEAMERVTGIGAQSEEELPTHPSLVFREMLNRLGTVLPASPKDLSVMFRA